MARTNILFLAKHRHPRLRYVLTELRRDLGYQFQLFTDEAKWESAHGKFRMTYGPGSSAKPAIPHLNGTDFLSGSAPTPADLRVHWPDEFPRIFLRKPDDPRTADLLSAIFYCLSRYEEYDDFTPDAHGRFPASAAHARENGYLHLPVVRYWISLTGQQLRTAYPDLPTPKTHAFRVQPTYDIDILWAYRYRGLRGLASGLRDLVQGQAKRAFRRFWPGARPDPYFTLDYLLQLTPAGDAPASAWCSPPQIFWLLADNAQRQDINPYPIPTEQKDLMRKLEGRVLNGIHPGYASHLDYERIKAESDRLRDITGRRTTHSRQHFLRLRLPQTYRALLLAGIDHDHSMGYGDGTGWRAGTNLPFGWYDLEREEATRMLVHPFAAMDATLKKYLQLKPAAAITEVLNLARDCQQFGGPFPLLWHNSSFASEYDWQGWELTYEEILRQLRMLIER